MSRPGEVDMDLDMKLEIRELDPFDDAALDAWHHVYQVAETFELGDAATAWQLEEVRAIMQAGGSQAWLGGWSGVVDGEVVGACWMRTPLLDNAELAEISVHVLPGHRRRGIGSALLDRLEAVARDRGRRILTGLTPWAYDAGSSGDWGSGPGFARASGFELALSEVQRELRLPVDEALLQRLADDAARAHSAYTLHSWSGPVPEALLQGWAEITSSLATEAPTGELEIEPEAGGVEEFRAYEGLMAEQGRTRYTTLAFAPDGSLAGYTELVATIHEPGRIYQWGTLVPTAHRGHRLGLALKVANLRFLQEQLPDAHSVTTWNAEVNSHMIGVNEQLGFRPVERLGEFQKRL